MIMTSTYCKRCLRAMGKDATGLEKRRGLHLLYCLFLLAANAAIIFYLFWRSYM